MGTKSKNRYWAVGQPPKYIWAKEGTKSVHYSVGFKLWKTTWDPDEENDLLVAGWREITPEEAALWFIVNGRGHESLG